MRNYLMVPVQLDALHVPGEELTVVDQMANFSVLPYFESTLKEEFNGETANISESIASQVFQNKNLRLGHGIHLHWSLPDALTRGDSSLNFPEVPDRWLVTRRKKEIVEGEEKWIQDNQWVVESNYLFPPHLDKQGVAVNIPYWSERTSQPYRYLGRKMPANAWKSKFADAEYYPSLTTVGYGEPTFAAFYPNCFSVFGFHDPNPGNDLINLRYEVVGWYSDQSKDFLSKYLSEHSRKPVTGAMADESDIEQVLENIEAEFHWKVKPGEDQVPDQMLCYAGLSFDNSSLDRVNKRHINSITVANTGTEALSACLADLISREHGKTATRNYLQSIEDQLEAMQMAFRLDEKKLDTVARFKELKHENSFSPVPSGHLWFIRNEVGATEDQDKKGKAPDLPPETESLLNELNELQQAYNAAWLEIDELRMQLFADWYKYMICVYPPETVQDYPSPDLVKHFVENKVMAPLQEKIAGTGEIEVITNEQNGHTIRLVVVEGSEANTLATRLTEKANQLIRQIENAENEINETLQSNDGQGISFNYFIEQIPGPRFWEPKPPVVLLEGEAARATKRHGQDGVPICSVFNLTQGSIYEGTNDFGKITAFVHALLNVDRQGLSIWKNQPWNPFMLEWQTQLFSTATKGNQNGGEGTYSEKFITSNYEAPVLHPDLEFKSGKGKITSRGKIYSGTSILTPQADELLKFHIEDQLVDKLAIFGSAEQISSGTYKGKKHLDNPVYTMILSYEKLNNLNVLSQSLDGFNQALLMRKQTIELSVDDPLAFDAYHSFSDEGVAKAMGGEIMHAPNPLNSFNPIRTGCLKILQLRLVDTFGQTMDIDTDRIDTTYKMTTPSSKYLVKLPPRLAQPARLNFRWLNGSQNNSETNNQLASSPICGWLMTNSFDKSVMFYNDHGKALGYFKAGAWREAIDNDHAIGVDEISNPHLKRVAKYVEESLKSDEGFLDDFIHVINDAMTNIQPENSMHEGAALLIGKPVAVVRASLNLELCGSPAVNQDWNVFRSDIAKNNRTSDNFTHVQFPVRLGEYGQLNDGLIGYWLETRSKEGSIMFTTESLDQRGNIVSDTKSKFYSPQSDYIDSASIESRFEHLSDGAINFYQSLNDKPQTVTMLMNPQGSVHATVGILPNKEITIPQHLYSEALKNIEVSFLHAPLLTRENKINLPLRPVSDYSWSWVERKNQEEWAELFPENRIEKAVFIQQWDKMNTGTSDQTHYTGQEMWELLLSKEMNWLGRVDDDEDGQLDAGIARVLEKDERLPISKVSSLKEKEPLIEDILDTWSVGIDPVETEAVFTGPQRLKEGWLKLRTL